ncbi:MAG: alpha/beta hydrolase [Synechococcaceae cyanobacterium]|nr:alpha/beta hydrolase [Synechococcaceae cyanobacterium]
MPSADSIPAATTAGAAAALEVIAMHGWAGTASNWLPWQQALPEGWSWQSGERGYGRSAPMMPRWRCDGRRVLIGHSLGPHLLPADLLAGADAVVLLASFGRFVPPGPEGRRLRNAMAIMAAQLEPQAGDEEAQAAARAQALLRRFLAEAAAPAAASLLPPGPADQPIEATGRRRLRDDLDLLLRCSGLPEGFPQRAAVLIVEAADDRIVLQASRSLLRRQLPQASRIELPGAGHCLLGSAVIPAVLDWLQTLPEGASP